MGINQVALSGNLTRDAELRHIGDGLAILGFGLAVNERRRKKDSDEWENYPNFVDCTIFGTRGEGIAPYLTKGAKVALQGRIHWSAWETEAGDKRSKLEVIVDQIEFLSPRNEADTAEPVPIEAEPAEAETGTPAASEKAAAPAKRAASK